jgi:endonuclease YncB( thermonuclease family)
LCRCDIKNPSNEETLNILHCEKALASVAKQPHQIPFFKMSKNLSSLFVIIFFSLFFYWLFSEVSTSNNPLESSKLTNNSQIIIISGVAKVIDGDSIEINDNQIRLIGIDAPEYAQKCFDKNEKKYSCGTASTDFLKKLINERNVECEYQEKDIYNRYLANCYLSEMNINYEMVKNGMAIIYNLKTANQEIKRLEVSAKKHKVGLWQGKFEEPKSFRKRNKRK